IYRIRWKHFSISMLGGVQIEHEVSERALELCAQIPIHREARAGKFCCALQVEHSKLLAQFPMWLWLKTELRRSAPAPDLHIVMFAASDGNARVRKVGNLRHHSAQLFFQLRRDLLLALAFLAQRLRVFH